MPRNAPLTTNRLKRLVGFAVGLVLFYAPFALLVRGFGAVFPASTAGTSVSDVHGACLRMPLGWLAQPWMWPSLGGSPIAWLPIAILPLAAVAAGPLFCGWLCPAGALPEYLSRADPRPVQVRLPPPSRHRPSALRVLRRIPARTVRVVEHLLFVLQLHAYAEPRERRVRRSVRVRVLQHDGRHRRSGLDRSSRACSRRAGAAGACSCVRPGPSWASSSWASRKAPWAFRVRADASACTSCGTCEDVCPMRATTVAEESEHVIDSHLCIQCQDCVSACPEGALEYRKPE